MTTHCVECGRKIDGVPVSVCIDCLVRPTCRVPDCGQPVTDDQSLIDAGWSHLCTVHASDEQYAEHFGGE